MWTSFIYFYSIAILLSIALINLHLNLKSSVLVFYNSLTSDSIWLKKDAKKYFFIEAILIKKFAECKTLRFQQELKCYIKCALYGLKGKFKCFLISSSLAQRIPFAFNPWYDSLCITAIWPAQKMATYIDVPAPIMNSS